MRAPVPIVAPPRGGAPASFGCLVVAVLVACGDAPSEVGGGEAKFDTTPPKFTDTCDDARGGTPNWAGIYTDYFAPSSRSTCAGDGACHGSQNQPGFGSSQFECADSKDTCRSSLLGGSGLVQIPKDQSTPDKSGLVSILRRDAGEGRTAGSMPKRPTCTFSAAAIDRIKAWIKNGAPND